jgi:hypothetical protein
MTYLQGLAYDRIVELNKLLTKTLPLVWNTCDNVHPSYTREKAESVKMLLDEQKEWLTALTLENREEEWPHEDII